MADTTLDTATELMDTTALIFVGIQGILLVGLLVLAHQSSLQFKGIPTWQTIWITFAIGFAGMLESLGVVTLFAYGIERPWMRWSTRYIIPIQTTAALFLAMFLITRLLTQIRSIRGLIHLPHPAGFVLDANSVVIEWDTGAEELFGWTANVAIGQTFMALVTPQRLRYQQIPLVERYLQSGGGQGISERYTLTVHPRGRSEEFPIEVLLTDDSEDNGAIRVKGIAKRLLTM